MVGILKSNLINATITCSIKTILFLFCFNAVMFSDSTWITSVESHPSEKQMLCAITSDSNYYAKLSILSIKTTKKIQSAGCIHRDSLIHVHKYNSDF